MPKTKKASTGNASLPRPCEIRARTMEKMVSLPPPILRQITQMDLAESDMLRREISRLMSAWCKKKREIQRALEAGATIEEGTRTVEVRQRRRLVIL
ncbi:MAG TPA: hypothetical protein VN788_08820 [Verrucomicrobiae bacterium]|nr:hypothetical protein [Verrucomicrobiae bacterium]